MRSKDREPHISIVIVTYNSSSFIEDCLLSIEHELTGRAYEIIIVDNASTEPLPPLEGRFANLRVIRNFDNKGFAAANNIGIQASTGDLIWLLNPDTVLVEGCIAAALRCFSADPKIGVLGTKLLNSDGSLQRSVFENVSIRNEILRIWAIPSMTKWLCEQVPMIRGLLLSLGLRSVKSLDSLEGTTDVPVVLGASMLLRRSMVDQIGMFDTRYFMYQEEGDLCYRAHRAGWKVVYCADAKVIHYGGHSTWDNAGQLYVERFKSLLLFFSLYFPKWKVLIFRLVLLLTAGFRTLLLPTPLYRMDLGLGNYRAKDRKIEFTRRMAAKTYWRLAILAFSSVATAQSGASSSRSVRNHM